MATRLILAELATDYQRQSGTEVAFESLGGVEAAKRVQAGGAFDVVVLATDALDKLIASGHLIADSKSDLACSSVAIAVRTGNSAFDFSSEESLKQAVLSAKSIGYSTGPSGTALLQLFQHWGVLEEVRWRMLQAPSGTPVGLSVANGDVELGFQQYSELMHLPGIEVTTMPIGCEIATIFSAGVCAASKQADAARALLAYMNSVGALETKQRHGMTDASNNHSFLRSKL